MNQFMYENFCNSKNFIFIKEELEKLNNLVNENNNVVLYSKGKFGKTSLIKEFFNDIIDKTVYMPIYIDIFSIVSTIDFIKIFYKRIASSLPYDNSNILKQLRVLFSKVNFTAIMNDDGSLDFEISLLTYEPIELFEDIYTGLNRIYDDTNQKIIVAFDDFWQIKQIKNLKIDLLLKNYINNTPHINYIFTDSRHRLLLDLFNKKKMPLYNLAIEFELQAIPLDQFYEFVKSEFDGKISYDIFKYIYNITDGEVQLIKEFCYHLVNMSKNRPLCIDDIDEVCLFLHDSKSEYFKMILNRLTLAQKVALKAVIISGGVELYTKNNLFKLQVTKASLNTAIKYLYGDEIIDKSENRYYISNKCFELWCKKNLI